MIRRLVEQRQAIDEFAVAKRSFDFTLSEQQWDDLKELTRILEASEDISKLFCSSRISGVIPYAKSLHQLVSTVRVKNDYLSRMRLTMKGEIEQRFLIKLDQK